MIIYRFRLTSEDQEDFFREIEIQPSQTFLDFHDIILSCSDLDRCDHAYFYITDTHYKKKQEISLKFQRKQVQKYDDEMDEMIVETYVPHLMEKSKMKDFVEDPHQRMIYEYTGRSKFVFFIELFRIYKSEDSFLLPRCVSKKGELPKKAEIQPVTEVEEDEPVTATSIFNAGGGGLFAGISEDESELKEIESQIGDILEEEEEGSAEAQVREKGEMEEQSDDDQEQMESLDEYDDLEELERKHRDFGNETDDY